jgi:hypothetical protein
MFSRMTDDHSEKLVVVTIVTADVGMFWIVNAFSNHVASFSSPNLIRGEISETMEASHRPLRLFHSLIQLSNSIFQNLDFMFLPLVISYNRLMESLPNSS